MTATNCVTKHLLPGNGTAAASASLSPALPPLRLIRGTRLRPMPWRQQLNLEPPHSPQIL